MKRKGNADLLLYIIMLFVMAIVIYIFTYFWSTVNTAWQAGDLPSESKAIISTQASKFSQVWDSWMIVAVIGFIIAIIIAALALPSHPAVAMIAMIILIIFGGLAVRFSNAFYAFYSTESMSSVRSSLPITTLVLNKLPIIIIAIGILFIVILYGKTQNQAPSV